jgi:hypothetical protein
MASIIVLIAAKPVTFRSPIPVKTELHSFLLRIDVDARLAAAAGGAARYLADSAGLSTDATSQLQNSVIAACQAEFQKLTQVDGCVEITLKRFVDRLEIALAHPGGSSTQDNPAISAGVDTIHHESRDGQSITRLTKFLSREIPLH